MFTPHNFTETPAEAAAVSLKAGTDIGISILFISIVLYSHLFLSDCGTTYGDNLMEAFNKSMITEAHLRKALSRQYASLVRYALQSSKNSLKLTK